jgi:low affinity Fe/Cu permease
MSTTSVEIKVVFFFFILNEITNLDISRLQKRINETETKNASKKKKITIMRGKKITYL